MRWPPNCWLAVAGAAVLSASPAHAGVVIGGSGGSTTVATRGTSAGTVQLNFGGYNTVPTATISGLTSKLTLTFDSVLGNTYKFIYTAANTSSSPITASRLSGFAFDVDPNVIGATSTAPFAYTSFNKNYPNTIGVVEVCFKDAKTGSCAGGASGGLKLGEAGTGSFSLYFDSTKPLPSTITLSNFAVRYQAIDSPLLKLNGASASGRVTSALVPVPEPGTWMLMLLGFGAIGAAMRRRREELLAPSLRSA